MQEVKIGGMDPAKEQELSDLFTGMQVRFDNVDLLSSLMANAALISELLIAAKVATLDEICDLYKISFRDATTPVSRPWPIAVTKIPDPSPPIAKH